MCIFCTTLKVLYDPVYVKRTFKPLTNQRTTWHYMLSDKLFMCRDQVQENLESQQLWNKCGFFMCTILTWSKLFIL